MAEKRKILLLTQLFPPETGAGQTRMLEFQKGLKANGFDVTVLTALPNYPTGSIFPEYRGKNVLWDKKEQILRTHIVPFKRKSSILRLITYLTFYHSAKNAEQKFLTDEKFDFVIASSPPIFTGLAGCEIAKRHNAKFIFDVRDVWPDIAINMGLIRKNSPAARWMENINRTILGRCDRVLVTTCSDHTLIAKKGFPEDKIVKIPNGASLETFHIIPDEQRKAGRMKLDFDDRFVVCYSGSFNQGMNDVLSFIPLAQRLKNETDILLLLIGDGENLPHIRDEVSRLNLANVMILPNQELDELNVTLNLTDMGIIPRKKLHNGSSGGLPVKMFECWALSKPVLLASGKGTEERLLLENTGGGYAVEPGDIESMAEMLIRLKNDSTQLQNAGERGRKSVEKSFSRQAALVKLVETINQM